MKKIYLIMMTLFCLCFYNEQAYAQEKSELQLYSYENYNKESEVADIEAMLKYSYCGSYEKLDICEYISYYNEDSNEIMYIYPIYDGNECVLMATTDGKGNVTITEDIRMYNSILDSECMGEYRTYMTGGNLYLKDKDECIDVFCATDMLGMHNVQSYSENDIANTYDSKGVKEKLNNVIEPMVIKNVDMESATEYRAVATTNSVSLSGTPMIGKYCSITNFVSQGNDGLCWAASVATIVNYKKNSMLYGVTARNVADRMEIGYNTGATLTQTRNALASYGLSYTASSSKLSWSKVKSNILADKPFIIGLSSQYGGHMITGYGYLCNVSDRQASARYVYAWDSNGFKITFGYNSSKIFTSGISFEWKTSLY